MCKMFIKRPAAGARRIVLLLNNFIKRFYYQIDFGKAARWRIPRAKGPAVSIRPNFGLGPVFPRSELGFALERISIGHSLLANLQFD